MCFYFSDPEVDNAAYINLLIFSIYTVPFIYYIKKTKRCQNNILLTKITLFQIKICEKLSPSQLLQHKRHAHKQVRGESSTMAENSLTDRTGTGENRPTFKDPLHVNDPLLNAIDDAENDAFDIEVLPSYLVF